MPNINPSFNSPALQKAFEQAKDPIERFYDDLDAISEDIKALEKWLEDSNLRVTFSASLELQDHRGQAWIGWEEDSKSGRWRIKYSEIFETGDGPVGNERPLIETPAETRKAIYPFLPSFLRMLAEKVKVEPLRRLTGLDEDEIDFSKAKPCGDAIGKVEEKGS